MAALPGPRAIVCVGPPLLRSGPSLGSPVRPGQVLSPKLRLWPPSAIAEDGSAAQPEPMLPATIVSWSLMSYAASGDWTDIPPPAPIASGALAEEPPAPTPLRARVALLTALGPPATSIAPPPPPAPPDPASPPPAPPAPAKLPKNVLLVTASGPPALKIPPPPAPAPPAPPPEVPSTPAPAPPGPARLPKIVEPTTDNAPTL